LAAEVFERGSSGKAPAPGGHQSVASVMAWFARRILARRLSITLGVDFCIEALEEVFAPAW